MIIGGDVVVPSDFQLPPFCGFKSFHRQKLQPRPVLLEELPTPGRAIHAPAPLVALHPPGDGSVQLRQGSPESLAQLSKDRWLARSTADSAAVLSLARFNVAGMINVP